MCARPLPATIPFACPEEARRARTGQPDGPDALRRCARPEWAIRDALSEYLWCFDQGLEHDRAFSGVRVSFLLSRIDQLGQKHPPSADELRKRRDTAREALAGGRGDFNAAMDFTSLNKNLDEPEQTLALYDRIKKDEIQPERIRNYLLDHSLDQLLIARRYKEVVATWPPCQGRRAIETLRADQRETAARRASP